MNVNVVANVADTANSTHTLICQRFTDIAILSVRLSVTFRYQMKTA